MYTKAGTKYRIGHPFSYDNCFKELILLLKEAGLQHYAATVYLTVHFLRIFGKADAPDIRTAWFPDIPAHISARR